MRVVVKPRSRDPVGVGRVKLGVRDLSSGRRKRLRDGTFRSRPGHRYRIRVRLFDAQGAPGEAATVFARG
jgi:hypothetical protein